MLLNMSLCHSSGSLSGSYVSSFLIKKSISFLLCSVRASRGLGFPLLPFNFFFNSLLFSFNIKTSVSVVCWQHIFHTTSPYVPACQLPHLLPLGSNKEVHKGFIPCCVSFLPDLCLPKYLDFFDHENKCQAGIQFTELELKPADDNRKERKTKSAEYPQLNAS